MGARGAVSSGQAALGSTRLLLLQTFAELSAAEETHGALVGSGVVGLLLPFAYSGSGVPAEEVLEAVVTLSNLAENPQTHDEAFSGRQGHRAFALFVQLLQARTGPLPSFFTPVSVAPSPAPPFPAPCRQPQPLPASLYSTRAPCSSACRVLRR